MTRIKEQLSSTGQSLARFVPIRFILLGTLAVMGFMLFYMPFSGAIASPNLQGVSPSPTAIAPDDDDEDYHDDDDWDDDDDDDDDDDN